MSGEDLYLLWVEAMGDQGVSVDDWDGMPENEQTAWNAIAAQVRLV